MQEQKCLLCSSTASIKGEGPLERRFSVDCPICGKYMYSDRVPNNLTNEDKTKLQAIIRERNIRGFPPVFMVVGESPAPNAITVEELLSQYPKTPIEMMNRALLNLSMLTNHPCDAVTLAYSSDYAVLFGRNGEDMIRMAKLLEAQGYIDRGGTLRSFEISITPSGWAKIEELEKRYVESKQVFVAMWFDKQMESIWKKGIKQAIENKEVGDFRALRIDLEEHNEKICDKIIAEIRRSRFVIADFTGDRGGVYYEAGYAMGIGLPVIWVVRKDWLDKVHFDTRQYNHIVYEKPEELSKALKNRIMATIPKQ